MIAVTGFGGLGKTALVSHWLKHGSIRREPACCGVFYWSFEVDPRVDAFAGAFLAFVEDIFPGEAGPGENEPFAILIRQLRTHRFLVVLDGLEVHQQGPVEIGRFFGEGGAAEPDLHVLVGSADETMRGRVNEPRLRRLLEEACCERWQSLIVVTSRYALTDLSSHVAGGTVALLDAKHLRLTDEEGANLLERCGASGIAREERRQISDKWHGHPLGLRLFARAVKRAGGLRHQELLRILDEEGILRTDADNDPLEYKFRTLVRFYEGHLSPVQRAILSAVSLFPTPLSLDVIRVIADEPSPVHGGLGELSPESLYAEVRALCREGLLVSRCDEDGREGYSCHPILRDHWYACLGQRQRDSVQPGILMEGLEELERSKGVREADTLPLLLLVIDRLLEAGEIRRADELFRTRLEEGRLFLKAGDPVAGKICVLHFVGDENRRDQCKEQLSEERLVSYLHMAGLFLFILLEVDHAIDCHLAAAATKRTTGETLNILLNHSLIWSLTGHPDRGEVVAEAASRLAMTMGDEEGRRNSLCCLGCVLSFQGRTSEANERFHAAHASALQGKEGRGALTGPNAVLWACHLLRLGKFAEARQLIEEAQSLIERKGNEPTDWENVPRYLWILACIDVGEKRFDKALENLERALSIFRRQHALLLVPFVLLSTADAYRRKGDLERAEDSCRDALELAASRRLALVQTESLILRTRIRLEGELAASDAHPVERDYAMGDLAAEADHGRVLAEQYHYGWLERDAILLLADIEQASGDTGAAAAYRNQAQSLSRNLLCDLASPVA